MPTYNNISGNLGTLGTNGTFEGDPSTWGFSLSSYGTLGRVSIKNSGNYGQRFRSTQTEYVAFHKFSQQKALLQPGKKYRIEAYVRQSSGAKMMPSDSEVFKISHIPDYDLFGQPVLKVTEIQATTKTQANMLDTWVKIEAIVDNPILQYVIFTIEVAGFTFSDPINDTGILYVDDFYVYEVEEQADPVCDIAIDIANTTVTDESTPGAGDGSINVAYTGTPRSTLEYSKNGGSTWQSSSLFAGLDDGIYNIVIRESADVSCSSAQSFSVNAGTASFDFTFTVEDESVSGANNGEIEVSVTGSGSPFNYSNDGGATYQNSNIFSDLAPGTYILVVKDNAGNTVSKQAIVDTGKIIFNKAYFSKNLIPFTLSETVNSANPNYRIYNIVQYREVNVSAFSKIMASALEPESDGKATFNNRPAFRGLFNPQPPAEGFSSYSRITDTSFYFRNKYGDVFNSLTEPASYTETTQDLIVFGGIDKRRFATDDFFTDYLPTNKKFLTWMPKEQIVDTNQEAFLDFYVYDPSVLRLKKRIKAYFDDDTDQTITAESTTTLNQYGRIYRFSAGPVASGATLINPAKNLVKYEIWIQDQEDNIISEVMVFKLSSFKPKNARYLLFLNSIGGWDVLRMTGKTIEQVEIDSEIVEKHLEFDYEALDGQFKGTNHQKIDNTSYSTGFYSGTYGKYQAEYLQEIPLSSKVFDITTGERIPIIIKPGTFKIEESKDYRYYMRFEATSAYKDEVFTPKSRPLLGA